MILYPTETVYGLGVNPLEDTELAKLYQIKGRDSAKAVSWLVRNIEDIERYAVVSPLAKQVVVQFLPGPLTLVLPAQEGDETLGFRISSDPVAQQLIDKFMAEHDAPLTCTSANVSGEQTLEHPQAILRQLGDNLDLIDRVIDDGPRVTQPSTVVMVDGDSLTIIREGSIPADDIRSLALENNA